MKKTMTPLSQPPVAGTDPRGLDPRWLAVKPRQLAALVAVGREHSFARAAVRLGCAQSAVSQLIAKLERALGLVLVERGRGRRRDTALTDAGRALARHGGAILDELEGIGHELGWARDLPPGGELRIGAGERAALRFVGPALARLLGELPNHRLVVNTSEPAWRQLALVEDGELAAAITDLRPSTSALTSAELWREPWRSSSARNRGRGRLRASPTSPARR